LLLVEILKFSFNFFGSINNKINLGLDLTFWGFWVIGSSWRCGVGWWKR